MPKTEKRCFRCGEIKLLTEFHKSKSRSDGHSYQCKVCTNAYYQQNKEAYQLRTKAYYEANRDNLREYMRAYNRSYLERNRIHIYSTRADYRARKRAALDEHVDRLVVWGRDEGHCCGCRKPVLLELMHLDHVIPLVRGGRHAYHNVQTLCGPCNHSKGARTNAEMGWLR